MEENATTAVLGGIRCAIDCRDRKETFDVSTVKRQREERLQDSKRCFHRWLAGKECTFKAMRPGSACRQKRDGCKGGKGQPITEHERSLVRAEIGWVLLQDLVKYELNEFFM